MFLAYARTKFILLFTRFLNAGSSIIETATYQVHLTSVTRARITHPCGFSFSYTHCSNDNIAERNDRAHRCCRDALSSLPLSDDEAARELIQRAVALARESVAEVAHSKRRSGNTRRVISLHITLCSSL